MKWGYITLDAAKRSITELKDNSKEFTQNKKMKNIKKRLRDIKEQEDLKCLKKYLRMRAVWILKSPFTCCLWET